MRRLRYAISLAADGTRAAATIFAYTTAAALLELTRPIWDRR